MTTPPPARSTPPAAPAAPLVAVACPACFGALAVGTDLAGRPADCPLCGGGFLVPPTQLPPSQPPEAVRPPKSAGQERADVKPRHVPARRHDAPAAAEAGRQEPHSTPEPAHAPAGPPTDTHAPQSDSALAFRDPVRTVGSGERVIVLRQLTPAERAARRARRNLLMLVGGVSILLTIVMLLGRKR